MHGIAHVTGGGFIENIPRMIPDGLRAAIRKGSWPVLPIFNLLQELGEVTESDMYNTFNMGIGMVMAVPADLADAVVTSLEASGEKAYRIGEIEAGEGGIVLC